MRTVYNHVFRRRRFQTYTLGTVKSGTTPLARLFEDNYRFVQEPAMDEAIGSESLICYREKRLIPVARLAIIAFFLTPFSGLAEPALLGGTCLTPLANGIRSIGDLVAGRAPASGSVSSLNYRIRISNGL